MFIQQVIAADMGYAYGYLLSKEISEAYFLLLSSLLGGSTVKDEVCCWNHQGSTLYTGLYAGADGTDSNGFGLAVGGLSGQSVAS